DNEHKHDADNDVLAVARPKLEEVFAAQLLVDFTKNVAHKSSELPCLPRGYHIRSAKATQTALSGALGRRQPVAVPTLRRRVSPRKTAGRPAGNGQNYDSSDG